MEIPKSKNPNKTYYDKDKVADDYYDVVGKNVNPNTHIILISSMSVLGEDCCPKKLRDMSSYAASKHIMEEMAVKFSRNGNVIARLCEAISPVSGDCFVEDSSQ